jgi:hypothetical protein
MPSSTWMLTVLEGHDISESALHQQVQRGEILWTWFHSRIVACQAYPGCCRPVVRASESPVGFICCSEGK